MIMFPGFFCLNHIFKNHIKCLHGSFKQTQQRASSERQWKYTRYDYISFGIVSLLNY